MKTDRELLELAAKAVGLDGCTIKVGRRIWNPLTDDGDALRLAVLLSLLNDLQTLIEHHIEEADYLADPYAATRRAIVLAAAEIGRQS